MPCVWHTARQIQHYDDRSGGFTWCLSSALIFTDGGLAASPVDMVELECLTTVGKYYMLNSAYTLSLVMFTQHLCYSASNDFYSSFMYTAVDGSFTGSM